MSKSKNFQNAVEWMSQPKIAISLGIMVVIAGLVMWFFWDKIRDAIDAAKAKQAAKEKEKELNSLYGTPTATIDFNSLAMQIYRAMKGAGTSEEVIYNALRQLNTQADWENLKLAYASVYEASHHGYNVLSYNLNNDLVASLQSELTTSELSKCRSILTANHINPGF